jgi:hypothetical protein
MRGRWAQLAAAADNFGFAVLATAVAMAAARLLLGRHLSALMTVTVLAGWSLLPGTLILFPVSPYGGGRS